MGGSSDNSSIITEINVTPFVDVLLVLLVIFMITAPSMTRSVGVNLPQDKLLKDKSPVEKSSLNTSLVLGLSDKGKVIYKKKKLKIAHFFNRFEKLVKNRDQIEKVFIQADRSVSYENLLKLMVFLKNKGHENVGLVFEQK